MTTSSLAMLADQLAWPRDMGSGACYSGETLGLYPPGIDSSSPIQESHGQSFSTSTFIYLLHALVGTNTRLSCTWI